MDYTKFSDVTFSRRRFCKIRWSGSNVTPYFRCIAKTKSIQKLASDPIVSQKNCLRDPSKVVRGDGPKKDSKRSRKEGELQLCRLVCIEPFEKEDFMSARWIGSNRVWFGFVCSFFFRKWVGSLKKKEVLSFVICGYRVFVRSGGKR